MSSHTTPTAIETIAEERVVNQSFLLQEARTKRLLVAALVVGGALAVAFIAQAQEQAAPKEHSMTGCLAKGTAADSFVVTDVEGTGPKSIGIVSSTADLAPHVSHKITVTGAAVPVKDAEGMSPAPPKAPHYMRITAVKMVSATCP